MESAWTWVRRSTGMQELSLSDQLKSNEEFALKRGLKIVRVFEPEDGYGSGLTIDRDANFLEMVRIAEGQKHGVRYLIVYDVSRFGRLQPEEKIYWEQRLKKVGRIQILYVKDDFKNDGSIGDILTRVVKHSEAHEYSRKLSELTFRGCLSHTALGNSAGGRAPYGYDRMLIDSHGNPVKKLGRGEHKADKLQRVKWVPGDPDKIATLREIFESYDRGNGLNTIVHSLNERGVQAPSGRHWHKSILHHILRNPTYVGRRVYNKTSYKGYRRGEKGSLHNPAEAWVVAEAAHEPIIDKELFERVQAKLKTKSIGRGRTYTHPHLLSGLIHCANCGYKFNGWTKTGNGHSYRYYACSGYHRIGKSVCRSVNILADELENLALDSIRKKINSPEWKESLKPTLTAMLKDLIQPKPEQNQKDLKKRIEAINQQIWNLIEALKSGVPAASIKEELNRLESQKSALEREIGGLDAREEMTDSIDEMIEKILSYQEFFTEEIWGQATHDEKKEFLKPFIYRINVAHSPKSIQATYYTYKIPLADKKIPGYAPIHVPGDLSLKSIAGVGFEPTTSRL